MTTKKVSARSERAAREAWRVMADLVLDNERRRKVSDQAGLSFGKVRALRRINRRPMIMRELADLLTMDPGNLTALIDDLEGAGLVERQSLPTNRRVKLVVITPEGAELARKADELLTAPPAGLYGLPAPELEELVRILSSVQSEEQPGRGDRP